MLILNNPEELRAQCKDWHRQGAEIALVPTMGYYHEGHQKLIETGRKLGQKLVTTLFVNPAQFGPNEDLASYPRDLQRDAAIAEKAGTDILFAPEADSMYAEDHATWVEVPDMGRPLCGQSRPIHFRGVCTIVLKLLMLSGADKAVFGEKDWQQQAILKRMARDLNLDVQIVTVPTVRENDGLAMSSRNVYLSAEERALAPHIYKGLQYTKGLYQSGERNAQHLKQATLAYWSKTIPAARLDYLAIVDPETLENLDILAENGLMACALRLGHARLIDNIILK